MFMSAPPQLRRTDKVMTEQRTAEVLARGYCGRVASVGQDGWPYCVPLLYVWADGKIFFHNAAAPGHLRANVTHDPRVCFEVDEAGEIFDYGRFVCDTSVAFSSVIVFGTVRIIDERPAKERFFDALMEKYGKPDTGRPKGFYPRLDDITLYALTIERMTGKETPLPAVEQQWPAVDRTKSPKAVPPGGAAVEA
jgi:nitroimidazol reductase NimA-like FMN-containing flavoprotein (pyridoxamine 5'-phosphate oxidase superfamily)